MLSRGGGWRLLGSPHLGGLWRLLVRSHRGRIGMEGECRETGVGGKKKRKRAGTGLPSKSGK